MKYGKQHHQQMKAEFLRLLRTGRPVRDVVKLVPISIRMIYLLKHDDPIFSQAWNDTNRETGRPAHYRCLTLQDVELRIFKRREYNRKYSRERRKRLNPHQPPRQLTSGKTRSYYKRHSDLWEQMSQAERDEVLASLREKERAYRVKMTETTIQKKRARELAYQRQRRKENLELQSFYMISTLKF